MYPFWLDVSVHDLVQATAFVAGAITVLIAMFTGRGVHV